MPATFPPSVSAWALNPLISSNHLQSFYRVFRLYSKNSNFLYNCRFFLNDFQSSILFGAYAEIANNIKKKILKENIKTAEKLDKKYPNIDANNIDELLSERDFSAIRQARLLSWCIESNEMIKKKFQEILKEYLNLNNGEEKAKFFELYKNDIVLYRNALAHVKNTPSIDSKMIIGEVDGKAVQFDQQLCDELRKKLLSYENILDEMYTFIEDNF